MAATIGNRFWELRSKHGRDKLFDSPELMWKAACEYFNWCQDNPMLEQDFVGKDATEVQRGKMRPFTMQGLCLYLDCNTAYFRSFKAQPRADKEDFSTVIAKIEETIYNQKFSGAAVGFFNAQIIARDLGLKDSSEHNLTGEIKIPVTGMKVE